jgi:hypothetical protein
VSPLRVRLILLFLLICPGQFGFYINLLIAAVKCRSSLFSIVQKLLSNQPVAVQVLQNGFIQLSLALRFKGFRKATQKGFWLHLAGSNSAGSGTAFRPTTHSYTTNQSAIAENGKNNFPYHNHHLYG